LGTDPLKRDSDGDGLNDGQEIEKAPTHCARIRIKMVCPTQPRCALVPIHVTPTRMATARRRSSVTSRSTRLATSPPWRWCPGCPVVPGSSVGGRSRSAGSPTFRGAGSTDLA
jgi:hypothetical protein